MRFFPLDQRQIVVLLAALLGGAARPGLIAGQQSQAPAPVRPLTLAQALEVAERNSETVGIAQQELARAQGDRRRARSGYFPQVHGSALYQRALESQFSALNSGSDT